MPLGGTLGQQRVVAFLQRGLKRINRKLPQLVERQRGVGLVAGSVNIAHFQHLKSLIYGRLGFVNHVNLAPVHGKTRRHYHARRLDLVGGVLHKRNFRLRGLLQHLEVLLVKNAFFTFVKMLRAAVAHLPIYARLHLNRSRVGKRHNLHLTNNGVQIGQRNHFFEAKSKGFAVVARPLESADYLAILQVEYPRIIFESTFF